MAAASAPATLPIRFIPVVVAIPIVIPVTISVAVPVANPVAIPVTVAIPVPAAAAEVVVEIPVVPVPAPVAVAIPVVIPAGIPEAVPIPVVMATIVVMMTLAARFYPREMSASAAAQILATVATIITSHIRNPLFPDWAVRRGAFVRAGPTASYVFGVHPVKLDRMRLIQRFF